MAKITKKNEVKAEKPNTKETSKISKKVADAKSQKEKENKIISPEVKPMAKSISKPKVDAKASKTLKEKPVDVSNNAVKPPIKEEKIIAEKTFGGGGDVPTPRAKNTIKETGKISKEKPVELPKPIINDKPMPKKVKETERISEKKTIEKVIPIEIPEPIIEAKPVSKKELKTAVAKKTKESEIIPEEKNVDIVINTPLAEIKAIEGKTKVDNIDTSDDAKLKRGRPKKPIDDDDSEPLLKHVKSASKKTPVKKELPMPKYYETPKKPVPYKREPKVEPEQPPKFIKSDARYSDEDLELFRSKINDSKQEATDELRMLRERLDDLTNYDFAEESMIYSMHMAEQGSEAMEKEKTYAQIQRINEYIKKLDEALQRISEKTYGICRICGCLIAKERLLAVPVTTLSASWKIHKKCPEDSIDRIEPFKEANAVS